MKNIEAATVSLKRSVDRLQISDSGDDHQQDDDDCSSVMTPQPPQVDRWAASPEPSSLSSRKQVLLPPLSSSRPPLSSTSTQGQSLASIMASNRTTLASIMSANRTKKSSLRKGGGFGSPLTGGGMGMGGRQYVMPSSMSSSFGSMPPSPSCGSVLDKRKILEKRMGPIFKEHNSRVSFGSSSDGSYQFPSVTKPTAAMDSPTPTLATLSPSTISSCSTLGSSSNSSSLGYGEASPSPFKRRRFQRRNSKTSAMLVSSMAIKALPLFNKDDDDEKEDADVAQKALDAKREESGTHNSWESDVKKAEELVNLVKQHRRKQLELYNQQQRMEQLQQQAGLPPPPPL